MTQEPGNFPAEMNPVGGLGENYISLLIDFPDPVLITDSRKRVVFLNRAAKTFFGDNLRQGDTCPLCSLASVFGSQEKTQAVLNGCLQEGYTLERAPVILKDCQAAI